MDPTRFEMNLPSEAFLEHRFYDLAPNPASRGNSLTGYDLDCESTRLSAKNIGSDNPTCRNAQFTHEKLLHYTFYTPNLD